MKKEFNKFGWNILLSFYCYLSNLNDVYANANVSTEIEEKVCNYQEAICPLNKCCSDSICKQEESSYKCCDVPVHFTRETFSDYIITTQGWGCSNCPKCDTDISSQYENDKTNQSGKTSSSQIGNEIGEALMAFGFIVLILGFAILILLDRIC